MTPILSTAAGNPENQDRGIILYAGERTVLSVADGAGGRSGGAEAAAMAVRFVEQHIGSLTGADSCIKLLQAMDSAITNDRIAGETTCALAILSGDLLLGASVGDSGVWLVGSGAVIVDLTERQIRKPFIGSGAAHPQGFEGRLGSGQTLLVATDGLLKYTSREQIALVCKEDSAEAIGQRLINLVRYPSGALPDDVTVIVHRL
jgi:serine/threonine protein phosphatase PrpC